jgi:hypothetical protein
MCYISSKKNSIFQCLGGRTSWVQDTKFEGSVHLAFHSRTMFSNLTLSYGLGWCSFQSTSINFTAASHQSLIVDPHSLFITSGEAEGVLSAYFGGRGECKSGSIEVWASDIHITISNSRK